jgi:hypothetical protein
LTNVGTAGITFTLEESEGIQENEGIEESEGRVCFGHEQSLQMIMFLGDHVLIAMLHCKFS